MIDAGITLLHEIIRFPQASYLKLGVAKSMIHKFINLLLVLQVVGVFMRNWDGRDETGHCNVDKEAEEAERICDKLDIPFREVNFVKEYWNEVFEPTVVDYQNGLTPNPDILCNRQVKFGHFHRLCREEVGCDAVATGHYARSSFGEDLEYADGAKRARLLKSSDLAKDQTFFLSQVPQAALRNHVFPVGGLLKHVVRSIAANSGFPDVAAKKESMGICFVGKRRNGFQSFLAEYVPPAPGDLVDVESGAVVGSHSGVHLWTHGQRVPLDGAESKYYVVAKDAAGKRLTVCRGSDHPALFTETFFTGKPHWVSGRQPDALRHGSKLLECEFRFQNTHPLTNCALTIGMSTTSAGNWEFMDQRTLTVSSAEPMRAVTPGQFVAFYLGDECLGSAVIERVGPSLFTMAGGSSKRTLSETNNPEQ